MSSHSFDHEKLDVYKLELQFITWVTKLVDEIPPERGSKARDVVDHLERASLSSLLNTAEGNGKRQRQVRARFFDDARGSAAECAACLDGLVAKVIFFPGRVLEGKGMLFRIVSMLTKMVEMFSERSAVREDEAQYGESSASEQRTTTTTAPMRTGEGDDEDDDEDDNLRRNLPCVRCK